ncbi:MBL fold metallo-hydrolase [Demetria terragena]|uniref:MBL fold metallo-hydrolase n=1 Tax=Demetria terragena TaxID=63959 RepID=UPI000368D93E|nr:MBL fold metallo-hydrolase [Demetria terragena]
MRLTVVGCAGSFAGPDSAASCYLVQAEHAGRTWSVLLDLGNGALGALHRHLDPADVDAVVISHLHPDHCVDLAGYYIVRTFHPDGVMPMLPVHAPDGAAARLSRVHALDDEEKPEHLRDRFDFHDLAHQESFTVGPFTLTPHRVEHPVEAYGIRVEADGAVLAYTGDTDSTPQLNALLQGATLALTDSAYIDGRDEVVGIHLSGSRAAQAAVDAGGVRRLMLTHIPAWNDPEICRAQAAEVWPGEVELAEAGRTYEL